MAFFETLLQHLTCEFLPCICLVRVVETSRCRVVGGMREWRAHKVSGVHRLRWCQRASLCAVVIGYLHGRACIITRTAVSAGLLGTRRMELISLSIHAVRWLNRCSLKPLRAVVPGWSTLLADPVQVLNAQPVRIGARRRYGNLLCVT